MLAYPDTCFKRKLLCVCVCLYYASCRFYLFEFILGESGGGLGKFYPLASSVSGRVVTARRHIRCLSDECFRSLRAFWHWKKKRLCVSQKKNRGTFAKSQTQYFVLSSYFCCRILYTILQTS